MYSVSVIIPIYNVEGYLRQCLDSVVNQTLKDIEIILVDDGSTDSSPRICDEYASKDSRIKVIHKQNEGLGKAYNVGLDNATAEYIGLIESDDFIELDMFEKLYNTAKDKNADVVKSNWYKYYSKPNVINEKARDFRQFKLGIPTNIKEQPELLRISPSIWSAIYKRVFLESHNIRFLETPGASYQDTSFSFKTTAAAECFVLLDVSYVHYRKDGEESSVHSKGKVFVICEEYKEIEKYLNDNPQIKEFAETYKWINQYYGYNWNLTRISEEYYQDFLAEFSKTFKTAQEQGLLKREFYERMGIKIFNLLINNPNKFLQIQIKNKKKNELKEKRRKLITLKLTTKQIRFSFLGKEYFNWEKQSDKG